ncbi:N-acetyltransferase [Algoriphagus lacus]|uniref:N-acetyltransferase n=1 Tax=Algoriphagus lacus TaxID=2056311 RepID=A0A418PNG7_9BACT|nr:GNAT family N-acetyltransferase [Algoriphagus lacus]RIW13432.1 N-acetyltransferase [Algoriphagus lacus]
MSDTIRTITKADLDQLKIVIESSGLFPAELLDGMVADYFSNSESEDIWLTKLDDNRPIAIVYCAPERLTDGTFNLYLIAVHKDFQAKGIGGQLMEYVEKLLQSKGKRILLVETSGLSEFELTRKFYDKCGYTREALIRDFYRDGEDKFVFWKKLS